MTDKIDTEKRNKIIYLDCNATTPLAHSVVDEINQALTSLWANPSSNSESGIEAKKAINLSRESICKMVNGNNASEVTFLSGGTEANNHVIQNSIKHYKKLRNSHKEFALKKPHIISSTIEHDSIIKVLDVLKKENIIDVTLVNVSKQLGYIDPQEVIQSICDETVLITIMLANNETGILQPISEICHRVKDHLKSRSPNLPRIFMHTDAAQAIGKIKVDVQELGVDYMSIVGHKFYAPRIGALWVRSQCPLYSMLYGAGQENGKRAGTENTCMIVGLGEASRLVTENIDSYSNHFNAIGKYFRKKLKESFVDNVIFNTPPENALPNTLNISFLGQGLQGRLVLDMCNYLQASIGAACHSHLVDKPSHILLAHGIPSDVAKNAIRLSIGRETSKEDIDIVVSDLKFAIDNLTGI